MTADVTMFKVKWESDNGHWYCYVRPDTQDWVVWSYLGSVHYLPCGRLWRWFFPRRFMAIVGGHDQRFKTRAEACEWVEDNSVWP